MSGRAGRRFRRRIDRVRARVLVRAAALAVTTMTVCHAARPRVLVTHEGTDAATRRLLAEVRNVGFDLVDVDVSPGKPATPVPAGYPGIVGVLALRKSGRIDVTVIVPDSGRTVYTVSVAPIGGTPPAVRAVEELHGRLTELRLVNTDARPDEGLSPPAAARPDASSAPAVAPPAASATLDGARAPEAPASDARSADLPPAADAPEAAEDDSPRREPQEPTVVSAPPEPERKDVREDAGRSRSAARNERWNVWVGAAAGMESGIAGATTAAAKLEARVAPWQRWSGALFAVLPLETQSISGTEGTADVRAQLFGAMVHFTPLELRDLLFVDTGVGMGAAWIEMNGHSSDPSFRGRDTGVVAPAALADVGVGVRAARWLSLRADALAGISFDRAAVRFEGRDAALWGPSALALTGGVEIDVVGLVHVVQR